MLTRLCISSEKVLEPGRSPRFGRKGRPRVGHTPSTEILEDDWDDEDLTVASVRAPPMDEGEGVEEIF